MAELDFMHQQQNTTETQLTSSGSCKDCLSSNQPRLPSGSATLMRLRGAARLRQRDAAFQAAELRMLHFRQRSPGSVMLQSRRTPERMQGGAATNERRRCRAQAPQVYSNERQRRRMVA